MAEPPRLFDVHAFADYLRAAGLSGATVHTARGLINSGKVPHVRCGKRFYVSKISVDAYLVKVERRRGQ